MATGERIRFIRNLRGMTQKWLGIATGFPEKSADIRIAQYESGTRTPKFEILRSIANILEVSPNALSVPDIDTELGIMHTLFALEDLYALKPSKNGDKISLTFSNPRMIEPKLSDMLPMWLEQAERYKNGEITKDEYDQWRYNFPQSANVNGYTDVMSPMLSDIVVDDLKNE